MQRPPYANIYSNIARIESFSVGSFGSASLYSYTLGVVERAGDKTGWPITQGMEETLV